VRLPEDVDDRLPLHDTPAERVRRLPADDQNGGARILDAVVQVMEHAPGLHHAAGADDDHRLIQGIEPLGVVDRAGVLEELEAENIGVVVTLQEFAGLPVVDFGMQAVDFGDIGRQGAVDVDRHTRQVAAGVKLVQQEDDLLCAADGEGRDDHRPASLPGFAQDALEGGLGIAGGLMLATAVGAFHDQDVRAGSGRDRVADDRDAGPADVPAEDQPQIAAGLLILNVQDDGGAAQHVPGIDQGHGHARHDRIGPVVGVAGEVVHGLRRVVHGVERLKGVLALAQPLFVDVLHIALLDGGAVHQHGGAQIAGGGGAQDFTVKATPGQGGNVA